MRRDMDLIRQLLIQIEDGDQGTGEGVELDFGDTPLLLAHGHLKLLKEANFIEADEVLDTEDEEFIHVTPTRLTWMGHEFLAAIRDKEIWAQTKAAAKMAGTEGFSAIWDVAKALGKAELKRRTGLEF